MHPAVVNRFGVGTHRDVFRDHSEFRSGLRNALIQGSLTRELVQEKILMRHELCVLACGGGEGIVPNEGLQTGCSAFAVGGVEKKFLVRRRMRRHRRSRKWRSILRVVLRLGGANEENKIEHRGRARGSDEAQTFHPELAANVDGAEVENNVAAGSGPAKTQHRSETGEEQNLVELMAQSWARGT